LAPWNSDDARGMGVIGVSEVNPKRAEHGRIVSRLPVSPGVRDLFVGREAELGRLARALDRANAGEGRLAFLVGEPGIGRTRIPRELAIRAGALGVAVRWGRCQETEGAPPYWPWVQVLRGPERIEPQTEAGDPVAGAFAALLADHVPRSAVVSEAESAHARFQLFDTVSGALRRVCGRTPPVIPLPGLPLAAAAAPLLPLVVAAQPAGGPVPS